MSRKPLPVIGQAIYVDKHGCEHQADILRLQENGAADLRMRWDGGTAQRYAIPTEGQFRTYRGSPRFRPRVYWKPKPDAEPPTGQT